jgi:REP element-mobilizing transposase RayT
MPNHVHLVFRLLPGNSGISKIMKGIKGTSARKSNLFLNKTGKFWQDESYDRLVRNEKELFFIIRYILMNPVKADLVNKWTDWENTFCDKDYMVL